MSFICVICRDLLKSSDDDASPRHQQLSLPNSPNTSNSNHVSTASNNVSGRSKKEKNNSIVATKCGHLFHYPCLSVWLSQSMNLTTDSKMRCPSCKQLIYIYELIQLFPVENGNGWNKDLGHIFSVPFHEKVKELLEQLENLCKDLNKKNNEISSPSKGNETPTRLQRIRDSPKKSQASQIAQLMKETDSLRSSIKELNSFIEQHTELGSIVEKQTKEISELRSKNEQLILANERLKSATATETEKEANTTDSTIIPASSRSTDVPQKNVLHEESIQTAHLCSNKKIITKTSQDSKTPSMNSSLLESVHIANVASDSSPSSNNGQRRKSVTFLDPFDEFDENDTTVKKPNGNIQIPFENRDFRVGDKVVWKFEGSPEIGTVKWKGFIGSQINVGVEFVSRHFTGGALKQLGLPIKDLSSDALQCIFKCKAGHGRLIPVHEVILFNKGTAANCSLVNSNYSDRVQGEATKTSNGMNKRMPVCTHQ